NLRITCASQHERGRAGRTCKVTRHGTIAEERTLECAHAGRAPFHLETDRFTVDDDMRQRKSRNVLGWDAERSFHLALRVLREVHLNGDVHRRSLNGSFPVSGRV